MKHFRLEYRCNVVTYNNYIDNNGRQTYDIYDTQVLFHDTLENLFDLMIDMFKGSLNRAYSESKISSLGEVEFNKVMNKFNKLSLTGLFQSLGYNYKVNSYTDSFNTVEFSEPYVVQVPTDENGSDLAVYDMPEMDILKNKIQIELNKLSEKGKEIFEDLKAIENEVQKAKESQDYALYLKLKEQFADK